MIKLSLLRDNLRIFFGGIFSLNIGNHEKTNKHLTKEQIEILLKLYYLGKYTSVAEERGITPAKVKVIEDKALRVIRVAYSKSYRQGKTFDGKTVFFDMAEGAELTFKELTDIFESYISEGFKSKDRVYWERIKRKSSNPTAIELLDFIFIKYELKIFPFSFEG